MARRRPGQRAAASKANGRSGYDIDLDKLVRARAKFESLSLGEAAAKYGTGLNVIHDPGRSYVCRDEHPTMVDSMLSVREIEIIFRLKDFAEGRSTSLKELNPGLHRKVLLAASMTARDAMARARRARTTPMMRAHAERLRTLPRYRLLEIGPELAESIPY